MSNNREEFSYLSITIVIGTLLGVLIGNFITESLGLGVSFFRKCEKDNMKKELMYNLLN